MTDVPENTESTAPTEAAGPADESVPVAEPNAAAEVSASNAQPNAAAEVSASDAATTEAAATPAAYLAPAVPSGATATPGWYVNPDDVNSEIYWDGTQWTPDSKRPRTSASAPGMQKHVRKGGFTLVLVGSLVGIATSVAGIAVDHSRSGGLLWFGGLLLALSFLVRGWSARNGMSKSQLISSGVLTGLAVLAAAGFGLDYLNTSSANAGLTASVGSCWTAPDKSGNIDLVKCTSKDAKQVGTSWSATQTGCPKTASYVGSVYIDTEKKFLCLAIK